MRFDCEAIRELTVFSSDFVAFESFQFFHCELFAVGGRNAQPLILLRLFFLFSSDGHGSDRTENSVFCFSAIAVDGTDYNGIW